MVCWWTAEVASLDRHVVRPRPGRLVMALLGCAVFVAAGAWMVATGGTIAVVVGLAGIAFFGGGALFGAWSRHVEDCRSSPSRPRVWR